MPKRGFVDLLIKQQTAVIETQLQLTKERIFVVEFTQRNRGSASQQKQLR